ncbi:hypothetical protein CFC21_059172 [Triticum aestivum]|uniref:DUF1618 domain-containing protein n=2 Tax=Triticum aestivum TaxID=4565 RepID=A0A3B6IY16_WHEAT|nr:hypothetical protein CFC21_059172 [Triticum aestivum]
MRPSMEPRFEASLCLPPDALDILSSGSTAVLPSWVLLDSLAYMVPPGSAVRNHTTAQTMMPDGRTIEVTFLIADPPRRSYWCVSVCCPDAAPHGDGNQEQEQEQEEEDNPLDCIPKVVSLADHLALIKVGLTTCNHWLWLVYSASARGPPSLLLLPDIHDHQPLMEPLGIVPSCECDNKLGGCIVAALSYNYQQVDPQYDLHLFSYHGEGSTWTCTQQHLSVDYGQTRRPRRLFPTKVISLGDGLLGWVDLWEGILVCDVHAAAAAAAAKEGGSATAHFVPMPRPLPGNQDLYRQHDSSARPLRDATFGHGHIRCVEIEQLVRPKPRAAPVVHDPSTLLLLLDSQSPMVPEKDEYEVVGWRLITWFRALTWGHWQRGAILHSDDLIGTRGNLAWEDLQTCSPLLCANDDDAVFLTSMLKNRPHQDKTDWIVTLDMKTKSMTNQPMPFSADRAPHDDPTHIACGLTKYLTSHDIANSDKLNTSGKKRPRLSQATQGQQQPLKKLLQPSSSGTGN